MGRKPLERVSQREYARRIGISNEAVSRAIKDGRIKKGWDEAAGKIIVEHADAEWGLLHKQQNVNKLLENRVDDAPRPPGSNSFSLTSGTTFGEAKRIRAVIQTQLIALELQEKKGELVKRDEVYKQLYAFGQQLRAAFSSIADRHVDEILSSKSRAEAHNVLSSVIYNMLEEVTTKQFDFTPRQ